MKFDSPVRVEDAVTTEKIVILISWRSLGSTRHTAIEGVERISKPSDPSTSSWYQQMKIPRANSPTRVARKSLDLSLLGGGLCAAAGPISVPGSGGADLGPAHLSSERDAGWLRGSAGAPGARSDLTKTSARGMAYDPRSRSGGPILGPSNG